MYQTKTKHFIGKHFARPIDSLVVFSSCVTNQIVVKNEKLDTYGVYLMLGCCLVIGSHGDPQVCRFVEGNII